MSRVIKFRVWDGRKKELKMSKSGFTMQRSYDLHRV